jgi:hypothetical protein
MAHERRPTGAYYEWRTELLSQGDIFAEVPLAYPMPADELAVEAGADQPGGRRFLSGPLDIGWAMLVTPTCSMMAQVPTRQYGHPVRTLVPLRPVGELLEHGVLDEAKRRLAEKRDALINYMYLPAAPDVGLPECLALLYMPVTLHHEMVVDNRVAQLTHAASCQLQKKLVWHASSVLLSRADFDPPMD